MNPSVAVILLNSAFGVEFLRFCLRGWGKAGYGEQAESLIILTGHGPHEALVHQGVGSLA